MCSSGLGEVREELEAEYNADPLAIGFNPRYVVELLTQMSSDQITIALGGELDPGLIRPLTGEDYLGVVLPMRIQALECRLVSPSGRKPLALRRSL